MSPDQRHDHAPERRIDGIAKPVVEDLGGGLKAEFALGMFLRADSGDAGRFTGDSFFGRGSYVGDPFAVFPHQAI